ncbi:helix-turn-helix domain-containing protein [Maritalea sp.]|uniref:helix-turn-helix domain-containing protein n=1 Tax=Maritalea sp. TaxID=2003361 RepID=UPI003EF86E4C
MSHEATNWAFKQYHLSSGEWRLLAILADCHNDELGCFPSQEHLIMRFGESHTKGKPNLARSTLNNYLNSLEEQGLIRREKRFDKSTFRQKSTRYILAFEDGWAQDVDVPCPENGHGNTQKAVSKKPQKPCPENGKSRVQILDTNPVIELKNKPKTREDTHEAQNHPPQPDPIPDVRDQFEESIWPHHWRSGDNSAKAFTEFEALSVEERAECVRVMEVAKADICKQQSNPEYRVGLAKWIQEKRFKGLVDAAFALEKNKAKMAGALTLDRFADAELFKACEQIKGKPVPDVMSRYMFPKSIIDKARASL